MPSGQSSTPSQPDPRSTLVAYGAPLFWKPLREMPLEEAVARALHLLTEDSALFLSLPVVLASNADELDGQVLVATARRLEAEAELGMVLTLTAELSGEVTFQSWADQCTKPPPGSPPRYLCRRLSRFQLEAADQGTPRAVAAWGFRVDLPEASFRQFFEKHSTGVPPDGKWRPPGGRGR